METKIAENIVSYLTFQLGEEEFAANVSKVLSILEMQEITKVPRAPEYMLGVINLRGQVLPVIDTRLKFGMEPKEYTSETCILVCEIENGGDIFNVGAVVDSVSEVIEIEEAAIQPPPSIGSSYKSDFIIGVANVSERFIMILDMVRIFSTEELVYLSDNNQGQSEDPA